MNSSIYLFQHYKYILNCNTFFFLFFFLYLVEHEHLIKPCPGPVFFLLMDLYETKEYCKMTKTI